MSKLKKLAVCLTALIITMSTILCCTVSADNPTAQDIKAGELPSDYEYLTVSDVSANWYYSNGTYIGSSDVQNYNDGTVQFKDTLYNAEFIGKVLELRVYFSVPSDLLDRYYNFYIQVNSVGLSRAEPSSDKQSLIKFSYNTAEQVNKKLSIYGNLDDLVDNGYNGYYYGYYVQSDSIKLSRNVIGLSLYYYINGYDSDYPNADLPIELMVAGCENSRDDPSTPAYDKPNTDKFDDLESLENQLTQDTTEQSAAEINRVNDNLIGSLQRFMSGFSAVSSLFLNFAGKVVDIQALIFISLAVGIVPLIVGLTVNGLREHDRNQARERFLQARARYRSGRGK